MKTTYIEKRDVYSVANEINMIITEDAIDYVLNNFDDEMINYQHEYWYQGVFELLMMYANWDNLIRMN